MKRLSVLFSAAALIAVVCSRAAALDCTGVSGNLVPACGVADAGEAASWVSNGSGATLAYSENGNPPGSLSADANLHLTEYAAGAWTACFQVLGSAEYSAGIEVYQQSGSAPAICDLALQYFSDATCDSGLNAPPLASGVTVNGVSWTLLSGTGTSDVSANSARLSIACESTEDFVVLFDNAIARPGSTVPVAIQEFVVE